MAASVLLRGGRLVLQTKQGALADGTGRLIDQTREKLRGAQAEGSRGLCGLVPHGLFHVDAMFLQGVVVHGRVGFVVVSFGKKSGGAVLAGCVITPQPEQRVRADERRGLDDQAREKLRGAQAERVRSAGGFAPKPRGHVDDTTFGWGGVF